MIVAARQRHPGSNSACRLRAQFGVSWQTVKRWIRWFVSPCSSGWRRSRGRLSADLRDDDLPAGLVDLVVPEIGAELTPLPDAELLEVPDDHDPIPPLMRKRLRDYAAPCLPPAYLPRD